jgi:hypothetical protein
LNGDIIITSRLFDRIDTAFWRFPGATVVSRRTDFNLSGEWQASDNPYEDLDQMLSNASRTGVLHDPYGIDLFALPAESNIVAKFPPFLVGVYRWDNWILFWSLIRERIPVIDISDFGVLLHALMPSNGFDHSSRRGAVYNDVLCKKEIGELFKVGTVLNADYVLETTEAGIEIIPNRNQSIAVTLARRLDSNGWLAIVAVKEAHMNLAYQWLCNAKRAGVTYYAFLALDDTSLATLQAANETVIGLRDFDFGADMEVIDYLPRRPDAQDPAAMQVQQAVSLRTRVFNQILQFCFNIIATDLDSIWIQVCPPFCRPFDSDLTAI